MKLLCISPIHCPGEYSTHYNQQPVLPDCFRCAVAAVALKSRPRKQIYRHINANGNCVTHRPPPDTFGSLGWFKGCEEIRDVRYRGCKEYGKCNPKKVFHDETISSTLLNTPVWPNMKSILYLGNIRQTSTII